jgi:hypothetical protein
MFLMEHSKLAAQLLSDNPILGEKIAKATGLNESKALLIEVLRFMELVQNSGERLTPSYKVDLAWHEFILFTKLYADFCAQHFDRFIHHYPGDNHSENKIGFKKLHYHYNKYFGSEPNPEFWGKVLVEIADESDCGTDLF